MPEISPAALTHIPVMLAEVMEALAAAPGRLYVDATLGLGGHSEALLERGARVLALDRDLESMALARARLARFEATGAFRAIHSDYRRILAVLAAERVGPVDGVLADLGVSSHQLLSPERGFSFASDAPLDMRLDRSEPGPTAADLVASLDERELTQMLREFGEEPEARRVARAIVRRRDEAPIATTHDLAELVRAAKPRRRPWIPERMHPATLTFQALRIAVNHELDGIGRFVADAASALKPGGHIAVIAFHSLEDRPVKTALRALEKGCVCPPEIPMCACGREPQLRPLWRKPRRPTEDECAANPRARSARLRADEKVSHEVAPELAA